MCLVDREKFVICDKKLNVSSRCSEIFALQARGEFETGNKCERSVTVFRFTRYFFHISQAAAGGACCNRLSVFLGRGCCQSVNDDSKLIGCFGVGLCVFVEAVSDICGQSLRGLNAKGVVGRI